MTHNEMYNIRTIQTHGPYGGGLNGASPSQTPTIFPLFGYVAPVLDKAHHRDVRGNRGTAA
jgi:hypothetical protein